MADSIKKWINDNLVYSRGLVCKKCKKEWFDKYNFTNQYQEILAITEFLDDISPTLPQRIWHILNDKLEKYKCHNLNCNNTTSFFAFTKGYLKTCCLTCAQFDPETIAKIKSTNLEKYGVEYGLSNVDIIKKRNDTLQKRYGVDNPSKIEGINEKKKQTCLKNYGVEWILQDFSKREIGMINKYGVDNNTKREDIRKRYSIEKKHLFYNSFFSTDRLKDKISPLFSKEEYKGVGIDHLFLCKKCGNQFMGKMEDGDIPRCLICYPTTGSSLFEKEITEYIKSVLLNEEIIENTKKILNGLELDIFIPSKKLAIECNGLYWHGEIGGNKNRLYHLHKTEQCEKQGIRLIHIFEDEWKFKKEIVKSRLQSIMLATNHTIFARKCKIREIDSTQSIKFLEENHLQGKDNSSIKFGLYYKDELISLMSFGKLRIILGNTPSPNVYEMYRFCSKLNTSVVGGASKLIKHFIKTYNPTKIISYADRRWSDGHLYKSLGFIKISSGSPNYWYFGKGNSYRRYHRFGYAKHTLSSKLKVFNPTISEWENMKLNGWDRIWDCGSTKHELIIH